MCFLALTMMSLDILVIHINVRSFFESCSDLGRGDILWK